MILRHFVQYECVNFASALFDAVSMFKSAKAAPNRILDVNSHLVDPTVLGPVPIVIDGGHFLHSVVWNTPCRCDTKLCELCAEAFPKPPCHRGL